VGGRRPVPRTHKHKAVTEIAGTAAGDGIGAWLANLRCFRPERRGGGGDYLWPVPLPSDVADRGRAILASLFPEPAPPGEYALALALLEEGQGQSLDFGRLVARWVDHQAGPFECPAVAASVAGLAQFGAPPTAAATGPGLGAALVTLPFVARLAGHPRNLVAGLYHLARLLDPDPVADFSAVAVGVTAACFLGGRRDFVPDVLEVLIGNDAPPPLIEEVRRVPVWRRAEPGPGADPVEAAVGRLGTLLWGVRHDPEGWADRLAGSGPSAVRLGRTLAFLQARVTSGG